MIATEGPFDHVAPQKLYSHHSFIACVDGASPTEHLQYAGARGCPGALQGRGWDIEAAAAASVCCASMEYENRTAAPRERLRSHCKLDVGRLHGEDAVVAEAGAPADVEAPEARVPHADVEALVVDAVAALEGQALEALETLEAVRGEGRRLIVSKRRQRRNHCCLYQSHRHSAQAAGPVR